MQPNVKYILYNDDCTKVLNKLEDDSIDLVVTSPPYNLGIKYNSYNDNMDWGSYYAWCDVWLREIYRVLKPDGRLCLNHCLSCGKSEHRHLPLMKLYDIATSLIGFNSHGLALWNDNTICKPTAWGSWLSASAPYISQTFEGVLILYKERWKKDGDGISTISSDDFMIGCHGLWNFSVSKRSEHPATFPIDLPKLCINLFSYKDDIVMDPFMGIGTTGIACYQLERKFIGVELDLIYFKLAEKNISELHKQLSLF